MSTNKDEETNIIQFPQHKIYRDSAGLNSEYLQIAGVRALENFSDTVSFDIIEALDQELENYGIETMTPEFQKDFSFLVEILKAMIYRSSGLPHGLQDFIDKHVTEIPKEEQVMTVELEQGPPLTKLTEATK